MSLLIKKKVEFKMFLHTTVNVNENINIKAVLDIADIHTPKE